MCAFDLLEMGKMFSLSELVCVCVCVCAFEGMCELHCLHKNGQ